MQSTATDHLTGLLNYSGWTQALDETLAAGKARGVILLNLDRFMYLNHVDGHLKGDEALVAVATALKRTGLLLGRLGGDEFPAVVLEGDTEAMAQEAWQAATKVLSAYETQAIRDLHSGPLHKSVERVLGVSAVALDLGAGQQATAAELLRRLSGALDEAKRSSRGRLVMLSPLYAADQWTADNQEALDSSNQFAEGGIPLERHRNF